MKKNIVGASRHQKFYQGNEQNKVLYKAFAPSGRRAKCNDNGDNGVDGESDAAVDVNSIAPHAPKGQKLVAQGSALGIIAFRPAP